MSDNGNQGNEPADGRRHIIKLKLVGQDSYEVHFQVKMSTKLGKLKHEFSERSRVQFHMLRFLYAGRRVSDEETPWQLRMENNDVIDVYQVTTGGGHI